MNATDPARHIYDQGVPSDPEAALVKANAATSAALEALRAEDPQAAAQAEAAVAAVATSFAYRFEDLEAAELKFPPSTLVRVPGGREGLYLGKKIVKSQTTTHQNGDHVVQFVKMPQGFVQEFGYKPSLIRAAR